MTDRPQQGPPRDASPDTQSDEQLVDRAAQGEGTALEMLYDRYKTMAYSLALRITSDPSLAEDAVQEAFLGVWRNASRYSAGRASARTWIMAITHHRAIDVLRRRRPTSELPEGDMPPPAGLVMPDLWPEVAGRLDRQAIVAAMSLLSEVQREAIELAYFGGLTQQEIALRTTTPLGTVKSRVRLGLLSLRRTLHESGVQGTELLASAEEPGAGVPAPQPSGGSAGQGQVQ